MDRPAAVKPQYAAFLVLVLLGKRRWPPPASAAVALFLVGSSLLLLGRDGFPAYAAAVLDLARFRVAEPLIAPTLMISWRGVLLNLLPAATPDGLGVAVALAFSGRRRWRSGRSGAAPGRRASPASTVSCWRRCW